MQASNSAADALERVDPDLRAALAILPDLGSLSVGTLSSLREAMGGAELEPSPPGLNVSWTECEPTEDGPATRALLYRPSGGRAGPRGALLYIHGGGYVSGSALRDDPAVRALALALDCVILSVDYRLAPETPFPGPLADVHAGLAWLHANAGRLGVDPARIAVRGNSAGGGLAAGLALQARDGGRYPIAQVVLVYPMLDDRTGDHPTAGSHVWTPQANRFGWSSYLAGWTQDGADKGYAVPARAAMLQGLPPTWIGVGALDLFVDENLEFGRRLMRAGVATEMHVYPAAYHGFNLIATAAVSQRFERDMRATLARVFST